MISRQYNLLSTKHQRGCGHENDKIQYLIIAKHTNAERLNPYPAKSIYSNFQPLELVSRYRDPQPQVVGMTNIYLI